MKQLNDESTWMQEKINELTNKVSELEEQIQNISIPIIPSILPNTVLIPFVGDLYPERFNMIIPKILSHVSDYTTEWAVLDFTAISVKETVSLTIMGQYIDNLTNALNLMGAEVIIVGLGPELTQELVKAGMPFIKEVDCFLDFRTALEHLMKKKRLAITKI